MDLAAAEWLADELVSWLMPVCERVTVAGSVRRQRATVKDIEIVVVPRLAYDLNLFGEPQPRALLDDLLGALIPQRLRWAEPKRNGARHKRLWVPSHGVAIDLFLATPENYGNILTIRTGDAEFSHLLVTSRAHGGCMPEGMRQREGYLWRGAERLVCPSEARFFQALGVDTVPEPAMRNAAQIHRLRAVAKVPR